jgi:hypothetical protein
VWLLVVTQPPSQQRERERERERERKREREREKEKERERLLGLLWLLGLIGNLGIRHHALHASWI